MTQKCHEKMEIDQSHVNEEDKASSLYWLIDWKDLTTAVVADDEKLTNLPMKIQQILTSRERKREKLLKPHTMHFS